MTTHKGTLLRPERLRTIERPFGWAPCRMLKNGTIAGMNPLERQLYLVLILAADRHGISFHGDKQIQCVIGCTRAELDLSRADLMARDLLAYNDTIYQLLSLPPDSAATLNTSSELSQPTKMAPNTEPDTRTSVIDHQQRSVMPESVRHILRDIFGGKSF